MVEPIIARAAGAFAGRFASQWVGDALKRRSIEKAYWEAAEAAIQQCEWRGFQPVWPAPSITWRVS